MNTIKPLSLGIITKVVEDRPDRGLSVGVLGFFDMTDPNTLMPDAEMWPFVQGVLPPNTALDLGVPKASAEILVYGNAIPPGGGAVPGMATEIAIAGIRKQAIVFGDRFWKIGTAGLQATPPVPFTEMPIDYAHAFGGDGFDDNPVGKGYRAERTTRAGQVAALPNIESPTRPITSPNDTPPPHCFAATDIAWPNRRRLAGTFDSHWTKNRFPAPPVDQNPALYNAAAPDQWISRWFNPGEPFTIGGMHPDHPRLQGNLPSVVARCFIRQQVKGVASLLQEVRLRLETVFLFPNKLRGVLLFRGGLKVAGAEAEDVTDIMIAYERASDPPRSNAHYLEVFRLRTDPETKGLYGLDDLQLSPELTPDALAMRAGEVDAHKVSMRARRQRRMDRAYDKAMEQAGVKPNPGTARPVLEEIDFPVLTPQAIARREFNVAGIVGAAKALTNQMVGRAATIRAEALATLAASQENAAVAAYVARPARPSPEQEVQAAEARVRQQMDQVLADRGADGPQLHAVLQKGAEIARSASPPPADQLKPEAVLGALAQTIRQKIAMAKEPERSALRDALAALDTPIKPGNRPAETSLETMLANAGQNVSPELRETLLTQMREMKEARNQALVIPVGMFELTPPLPAPAGQKDKSPAEQMEAAAALHSSMADGKTSQQRLDEIAELQRERSRTPRLRSPIAIAPAENLTDEQREALRRTAVDAAALGRGLLGHDFAGADLSGLNLHGMPLAGAMFERANLVGTDFSGCNLINAVFTEADLSGAVFTGADLSGANLCATKAKGARFQGAEMKQAQVMKAVFTGADFSGTRFDRNLFIDTGLGNAVLRDTVWEKCVAVRADLNGADFSGAKMRLTGFIECQMVGAIGHGATLYRVALSKCMANGIDLSQARLTRMAAAGTSLIGGVFRRCLGTRSTWFKSDLRGADFARAELCEAFLGDNMAAEASFYRADLRRAFLSGTDFTGADFAEANLLRATLRRAVMDRAELRQACLYGLQEDGTTWQMADLTCANLRLTAFTRG